VFAPSPLVVDGWEGSGVRTMNELYPHPIAGGEGEVGQMADRSGFQP